MGPLLFVTRRRITGIALMLVGGLVSCALSEPDEKVAMLVLLVFSAALLAMITRGARQR